MQKSVITYIRNNELFTGKKNHMLLTHCFIFVGENEIESET